MSLFIENNVGLETSNIVDYIWKECELNLEIIQSCGGGDFSQSKTIATENPSWALHCSG